VKVLACFYVGKAGGSGPTRAEKTTDISFSPLREKGEDCNPKMKEKKGLAWQNRPAKKNPGNNNLHGKNRNGFSWSSGVSRHY